MANIIPTPTGAMVLPGQSYTPGEPIIPINALPRSAQGADPSFMDYKPSNYGSPFIEDDTSIVQPYMLNTWHDDHQNRIRTGMLVFSANHIDKAYGRTTWATIAKVNETLRSNYMDFKKVADENSTLKQYLEANPENRVAEYAARVKCGLPGNQADSEGYTSATTHETNWALTTYGIMRKWTFLGVVQTMDRAESASHYSYDQQFRSGAAVTDKKATVYNVWGNKDKVVSGSKLWLILKRVKTRGGGWGHFQYEPYVSRNQEIPPRSARYFLDQSSTVQLGQCIYVGTVYRPPVKNPMENARLLSIGVGGSESQSFEAIAAMPLMEIQLKR